jgi:hypothetical protein
MKKTLFFISLGLIYSSFMIAQEVTISSNAKIQVAAKASLNVNGLALTPSGNYDFTENILTKSATAIVVGSNESMNRVYTAENPVTAFQGTIAFNYEDADENGILDNEVVLEINQDGVWTNYPDIDEMDNMITSTFDSAINFKQITASSADATLTVGKVLDEIIVRVYPNPVVNKLHIAHKDAIEATLFNRLGQEVLRTYQKTIDFSSLAKGLYILKIKTNKNNTNNFKIIKK